MTRLQRILAATTLDELYACIPQPVGCTGECWDSCGPIGYSAAEGERMETAGHRPPNAHEPRSQFMCTALTRQHTCRVYDARPAICRLWGVSEVMPCNHGDCHTPNPLTDAEAQALMARVQQIGGDPPGFREHFARKFEHLTDTISRARTAEGV